MKSIRVYNREIGPGFPMFIIAEASSNHNRDFSRAKNMIDVAAEAGADAVKFQLFISEKMAADTDDLRALTKEGSMGGAITERKKLIDLYRENELPRSWIPKLAQYASDKNIIFMATPFDAEAVDLLESINVPAHKIASYEMLDVSLLRKIAKTQKPIFLSTGIANLSEVQDAVQVLENSGNKNIILLHCHSGYPTHPHEANLHAMRTMQHVFNVPVGFSDHTQGITIPIAVAALGGAAIEKHFTLKGESSIDQTCSLNENELKDMVKSIRATESALGDGKKEPTEHEKKEQLQSRRSLWIVRDIKKGEKLTTQNVHCLRPGMGLDPRFYELVLGCRATSNLPAGHALRWPDILYGKK